MVETGGQVDYSARCISSIHDVDREQWDGLAGTDNPFVLHDFLACLEDSGSASPDTGWGPAHILLEDSAHNLQGAAPAWFKSHSMGEYVFDQGLAEAFERAGGHYYPKLLVAVPFTPVTGPRLLADGSGERQRALASAIVGVASNARVSSVHINFLTAQESDVVSGLGFLQRTGIQFHWENRGYASFDEFLASLSSRKRKAIRRERREIAASDISIHRLTGNELTAEIWDAFYGFYRDTGNRKWGIPYLTRAFFDQLGQRMAHNVVLIMCRRDNRWIAGALNIRGSSTLFGRYWGCIEDHRMLHFECCYYQAIEHAICHGLARVEAGAQGGHKIQRGYMPVTTRSSHWFANRGMQQAVSRFFADEGVHIDEQVNYIERELSPFRHTFDHGLVPLDFEAERVVVGDDHDDMPATDEVPEQ